MNGILLKQISILSAIVGAILGVITIIPLLGSFSFLFIIALMGAGLIVYMKKMSLIGFLEPNDGAIFGGIAGFISFLGFSVTFLPLCTIIGVFAKFSFYAGIKSLVLGFISMPFLLIVFVVLTALMSALMNAFSGMVAAYIYTQIETKPDESITNFEIEE